MMEDFNEDGRLLSKRSSNQYGSVNSQEDKEVNSGETGAQYKHRWTSIRILYLTMFFSSVQFAIVMSSLWPYLKKVDNDISETFLGWTNSGFSLCQAFGSIFLGIWCHHRPAKEPLIFSLVAQITGSFIYAYAENFRGFGKYAIFLGRLLLGISAGNTAVCRAVVSQSTTLEERTNAFSNTAIAQALAFFFGPAMQVAVVPFGNKGIHLNSIELSVNIYTAPGILGIIMGLGNLVLLIWKFKEHNVNIYDESPIPKQTQNLPRPDRKAVVVTSLLFFVVLCIFALNETIITPLVMDEFAWTSHQAVLYGGIILSVSGVLSVLCFQSVKKLVNRFGGRNILTFGFLIMLAGFIIYIPWGRKYPLLKGSDMIQKKIVDAKLGNVGCPIQYKWCHNTPQIYLSQFLVGLTFVATGYAYAILILNTIYSKLLGPGQHGYYMASLSAVGSFARVVGPLLVSNSYVSIGPRWTFLMVDFILTLSILLLALYRHRLIPFHEYVSTYAYAQI